MNIPSELTMGMPSDPKMTAQANRPDRRGTIDDDPDPARLNLAIPAPLATRTYAHHLV
jgi:hypothetical protein